MEHCENAPSACAWLSERVRLVACDFFYGREVERPRQPKGACENPRGTVYHAERRVAMRAGCRSWKCRPCGKRKTARVAERFSRLEPIS